ncbi:MAG: Co-chaperone protein HscB [Candidatus Scalindua rubra]|uniref:Co-chaperone protein HscB n=1 Tax=Candidatus Scalindua rubra TaxID=1872076 RepID=A0A1E3X5P3_9BACT|nr:MAG: Co-chaperone protein HscB [Candidatus Scalindua rubra]
MHPDKFLDHAEKNKRLEMCKLMNEAYNILSDTHKRNKYDICLFDTYSSVSNSNTTRRGETVSVGFGFRGYAFCFVIFFVVLAALFLGRLVIHVGIKGNTAFIITFFFVFFSGCFLVRKIRLKKGEV